MKILVTFLTLQLLATASCVRAGEPLLKQGQARVVFVGDSITGLSRNYVTGFAHQMDWALGQTYPGCKPNLVALGGSGQGVRSWSDVEVRSRTEGVMLDVRGIDVQATLTQHADVLVIMLGMNDVLSPYVNDEPAALDEWKKNYRTLIAALQARLHPQVTALASATLCTEDLESPKNRMIDKLNAQAATLAKEMDLLWLPTNEMMRETLEQGRRRQPDFHVTYDYVHPNEPGHIAIAMAMLRGLGEDAAARTLADQRLRKALGKSDDDSPKLSFKLQALPTSVNEERQSFRVRYWLSNSQAPGAAAPRVSLSGDEWIVSPAVIDGVEGEFVMTGEPNKRQNILRLTAIVDDQSVNRDVRIPAPWLVTAGFIVPAWNGQTLDVVKARGSIDEAIEAGRDVMAESELSGRKPQWLQIYPSVDYTGGDAPGSVDFAAVTHAKTFEAGYGVRWIHSDRDRTVNLALNTRAFAGTHHLTVSLNGLQVYSGLLTSEPNRSKTVEARLHRGWNSLAFRSNHVSWQWQCTVDLKPTDEDSLDDLRYSTVPKLTEPNLQGR